MFGKIYGQDLLGWSSLLGSGIQQVAGARDVFRCDDFEALRGAAFSGFGIVLLSGLVVGQDVAAGAETHSADSA